MKTPEAVSAIDVQLFDTFACNYQGHRRTGRGAGGGCLSTLIRAESRHYSGKTQYMFE